ncbi:hypothetical protein PVA48_02740 [Akkermansia sp. JRP_AM1]
MPHRSSYCLSRHAPSIPARGHLPGNLSVSGNLSVGNVAENLPYGLAELSPTGASGNSATGGLPPAKYLSSQSLAAANTGRPSLSSMSPLTVSPKYFWPSSHKPARCSPSLASVSGPRGDE